jgi:hypothetical protein
VLVPALRSDLQRPHDHLRHLDSMVMQFELHEKKRKKSKQAVR